MNKEELRQIFQSPFNEDSWKKVLKDIFHVEHIKIIPREIDLEKEKVVCKQYGEIDSECLIGFYEFCISKENTSIRNNRVGLRMLTHSLSKWKDDGLIAVFHKKDEPLWRVSFISDLQGNKTSLKRYTFVFGEKDNLYKTPIERFLYLQDHNVSFSSLKEVFSVEALTKQFYNELFSWYQWVLSPNSNVTFPNNTKIQEDDREDLDTKIIRLITRIIFVWFIKQKQLVPNKLFDKDFLNTILKEFNPLSDTNGDFYNAILQNLFFATLNRAIIDENGQKRGFAEADGKDVKTLYRYDELFSINKEEIINLFSSIPFLNGGLFECLDKTKTIDGVDTAYYYDGFSRNDKKFADGTYRNRATIPNVYFFDEEKGLISILQRYNFTIEENSPNDAIVSLDPELLGKVFENLLGVYNPETNETARNSSGSFYTPREVVNYMVDESIIAYLGDNDITRSLFVEDFVKDDNLQKQYNLIETKLKHVKILDPACGSGAFPMGLLNRIVDILQKINPVANIYDLKLHIIENCIYGSDIQNIATQISKLRFFISLICDCEKDESKDNFGIPTLPNLETKFVATNSLIRKTMYTRDSGRQASLFEDSQITTLQQELNSIRQKHFLAKTRFSKISLRNKDRALREKLIALLEKDNNIEMNDAKQFASWDPYDQNSVAQFFDPEWMFGIKQFDIVIGNPPYIQLQNNSGALANLYSPYNYKSFARTGDIYCLFYERGWEVLKQGGILCYITSNKWMRAGYGEKLRDFFANNTNPEILLDFAGVRIFESATVDTNILLFSKQTNNKMTKSIVFDRKDASSVKNLSDFVQQNYQICSFTTSDSWVILSKIEQSIKDKIESVGTPLKDWDIKINYGIKTGCNEAFIIDTAKREEILANCTNEEERQKTAELIRPILRGRDIKRYSYDWAGLWLIALFPSRHYNIDEYPAVKQYLLDFGKERLEQTGKTYIVNDIKIKSRKKTNNKWFETQDSISYWEDFFKPKICYGQFQNGAEYSFAEEGIFLSSNEYMLITRNYSSKCLLAFLNSTTYEWLLSNLTGNLSDNTKIGQKSNFLKLSIVQLSTEDQKEFDVLVNQILQNKKQKLNSNDLERKIDLLIYKIFNFSKEEIDYIENKIKQVRVI